MAKSISKNKDNEGQSREIIIATKEDLPGYTRPACPECGHAPISRGFSWHCTNCGRRWQKELRRTCFDCPLKLPTHINK
jgi:predicted RNA-binding Zn-ribbon protein involved in translation (DUF1610 family)